MTEPLTNPVDEDMTHYRGQKLAVYNPNNIPLEELPIIYGFNNGGPYGWMSGCLLAQDGTGLGGHVCSNESFMLGDLGILEGYRADRHDGFRDHYPSGYRMRFISYSDVPDCAGLVEAFRLHDLANEGDEEAADERL